MASAPVVTLLLKPHDLSAPDHGIASARGLQQAAISSKATHDEFAETLSQQTRQRNHPDAGG